MVANIDFQIKYWNGSSKNFKCASSAAAERNFCLFSRTHTKIRNRLKQLRVLKLISIRANLNMCDKTNGREGPVVDRSEDEYDTGDSEPQSDVEVSDATDPLDNAIDPLS